MSYVHTKEGVEIDADELTEISKYTTVATITVKSIYADEYALPTESDVNYIPIAFGVYDSVTIEEGSIKISFTWKGYSSIKNVEYSWIGESEYSNGEQFTLPSVEFNDNVAFAVQYAYYRYDDSLKKYVKINETPDAVGKYKVSAIFVAQKFIGTTTVIEDFEFEIV